MATEREYKFSLQGSQLPHTEELRRVVAQAGLTLSGPQHSEQRDTYYDGRRGYLAAAGAALRRRQTAGGQLAAFKGPRRGQGALYEREELELPLVEGDWPPAVASRVARYGPVYSLRPTIELSVARRRYGVCQGEQEIAELAIDEVRARRPGSEMETGFAELELEDSGAGASLEALARLLEAELQLTASPAGKLERAKALLSLGAALETDR